MSSRAHPPAAGLGPGPLQGLTLHAGGPVTAPQPRGRALLGKQREEPCACGGHREALLGCPLSAGAGLTVVHAAHLCEPTREQFCCQNHSFETKGPRTLNPGGLHAPRSSHHLQCHLQATSPWPVRRPGGMRKGSGHFLPSGLAKRLPHLQPCPLTSPLPPSPLPCPLTCPLTGLAPRQVPSIPR